METCWDVGGMSIIWTGGAETGFGGEVDWGLLEVCTPPLCIVE